MQNVAGITRRAQFPASSTAAISCRTYVLQASWGHKMSWLVIGLALGRGGDRSRCLAATLALLMQLLRQDADGSHESLPLAAQVTGASSTRCIYMAAATRRQRFG